MANLTHPLDGMKISDLILKLERVVEEHGDLPVRTQTLSHLWEPELKVKGQGSLKHLLLNA